MAMEIAAEYLDHLHHSKPQLRSFLHDSKMVMREAKEVNRLVESGVELGPLTGVLVAMKDNIYTADMPLTGGSRILGSYRLAFDAMVVRRLQEAGAILVGKTNLDKFGMGSTIESSGFQEVSDYASQLVSLDHLESKPLKGLRVRVIRETIGEGVDLGVMSFVQAAASHLE